MLGLQDVPHTRPSRLVVSCPGTRAVNGTYELVSGCGAPLDVLYKHQSRNMWIVLESGKCSSQDTVVVTNAPHPGSPLFQRRIYLRLEPAWRPSRCGHQQVAATVASWGTQHEWEVLPGHDRNDDACTLQLMHISPDSSCKEPLPYLRCTKNQGVPIKWLLARADMCESDWRVFVPGECSGCCCPQEPPFRWQQVSRNQQVSWEAAQDQRDLAAFETACKARPLLVTTTENHEIQLNVVSLLHIARGKLPTRQVPVEMAYRVVVNSRKSKWTERAAERGTEREATDGTVPLLECPLRPDQLQTLAWMLDRERSGTWCEQSLVTVPITNTNYELHARAEQQVDARGGVVADAIGFGKTAVSIGLMMATLDEQLEHLPDLHESCIVTSATLVIVPDHLLGQWPAEITKFAGKERLKVHTVKTFQDLKRMGVDDYVNLDVLLIGFGVLHCKAHLDQLDPRLHGVKHNPTAFRDLYTERLRATSSGEHATTFESNEVFRMDSKRKVYKQGLQTVNQSCALVAEEFSSQMDECLLEAVCFRRVIIDEFTYLQQKPVAWIVATVGVRAICRWGLSGTTECKTMADAFMLGELLGVHVCALPKRSRFLQELDTTPTNPQHQAAQTANFDRTFIHRSERVAAAFATRESHMVVHLDAIERFQYENLLIDQHRTPAVNATEQVLTLCAIGSQQDLPKERVRQLHVERATQRARIRVAMAALREWDAQMLADFASCIAQRTAVASTEEVYQELTDLLQESTAVACRHTYEAATARDAGVNLRQACIDLANTTHNLAVAQHTSTALCACGQPADGVSSDCGHTSCGWCFQDHVANRQCGWAGCQVVPTQGAWLASHVVCDAFAQSTIAPHATKIEMLVPLLRSIMAQGERILLFAQFEQLLEQVIEELDQCDVPVVTLNGDVHQQIQVVQQMQSGKGDAPQILGLVSVHESASGINLTTANHVVFVHPTVSGKATSYEEQAIGRIRRWGQARECCIWRFVCEDTIEMQKVNT